MVPLPSDLCQATVLLKVDYQSWDVIILGEFEQGDEEPLSVSW